MPAKRSVARRKAVARRRTTARRKHPARRVKIPRRGPLHARLGTWLVLRVVVPMVTTRRDILTARKAAAIRRITHEGCTTCGGLGQVHTRNKKTGELTGSKPCPAQPTKEKVSRLEVNKAARMGGSKRSGLVGWSCPCGKKEKARYQDPKAATAALRAHEKDKHGSKSVGGTWYAQTNGATPQTSPKKAEPVPSKVVTNSGKTDAQWIKQNKGTPVGKAIAAGKCWKCSGDGKLHAVFGNEQLLVVCPECRGKGAAPKAA